MTRGDPWDGIAVLLVDGNNLLHALEGHAGTVAVRGLLARLGDRVPSAVEATVVLDGSPDAGAPMSARVRRGLVVRHSGRVSADAVIVQLVEAHPYLLRADVVVVTDDAELSDRVRRAGGRPRRVAWLESRLVGRRPATATPGTSIGAARPRAGGATPPPGQARSAGGPIRTTRSASAPDASGGIRGPAEGVDRAPGEDAEREPWRPGRGATRKRGNPRRGH